MASTSGPLFPTVPEPVMGTVSMRYLEQQIARAAEETAAAEDIDFVRAVNKQEAHFMSIANKFKLSNRCSEEILKFCRSLGGDGVNLGTYRRMKTSATGDAADQTEYNYLRIPVPSQYTESGLEYVEFECIDILSVIVDILSDPEVVSSMDDFTNQHEVVMEDGVRVFTPDVNSGMCARQCNHELPELSTH